MNIAVFGSQGRVGSKVVELAQKRGHKVYGIDKKTLENIDRSENSGKSCENIKGTHDFYAEIDKIDVVIDFSTAEATTEVYDFCKYHLCPLVSGVTGRNDEQLRLVEQLSETVPVICKANFSVGVEMLHRICQIVAKELREWDCEIVETHRKGKIDSPSGTAISLASDIAQQKSFRKVTIHSLRCGSNFGRHSVILATQGESLTLTHQAENVDIFAKGALLEAEKLVNLI